MKKYAFLLSVLMVLVFAGLMVSATGTAVAPSKKTNIGGTIYNSDYSSTISGANVTVTCNGFNKNTLSNANGVYSVEFIASECTVGDSVTVVAVKGSLSGVETESVYDFGLTVNLAIVNVPIVPEFGFVLGLATLLGAVGIFFIVRRQ